MGAKRRAIDDSTRIECESPALVTVRRTGGSAGEVSVDYQTVDGTATAGDPSAGQRTASREA